MSLVPTVRVSLTTVALTVAVLVANGAWAQGNVIVFEEETIQVEIEKPEAFYILSPSNLEYQGLDPEESFLEELYETVEEAPF
jgi:hypothetical protein